MSSHLLNVALTKNVKPSVSKRKLIDIRRFAHTSRYPAYIVDNKYSVWASWNMNKTNAREHIHAESVVWQYRKVKPNKIHTTVSKHSVGIWPICLIARTISSKCSKKKSKGKTNLLETSLKNRSSWKRVSPKSKLYSYLMTMIWRRKLGLRRSRMTRFLVIFTLEAILTSPQAK